MKVKVFVAVDPGRPFFHFKCLKNKGVSIDDKNAAVALRQHGNTFVQITLETRAGKGKSNRCRLFLFLAVKENRIFSVRFAMVDHIKFYIIPDPGRECIGAGFIDLVI